MTTAVNQCDGCLRGLALGNGRHYDDHDRVVMTCTADRYGAAMTAPDISPEAVEKRAQYLDGEGYFDCAEALRALRSALTASGDYVIELRGALQELLDSGACDFHGGNQMLDRTGCKICDATWKARAILAKGETK